ncbi:MAG: hypothetical protein FJ100_06420 [Deltaproteobacteria bacterium]|nr:hypothetical protein [Deltaproteobacteria bacterium]
MNPGRLIPSLLLATGTVGAAKNGPEVAAKITDTIKIVLVRYELAQLAQTYDRDAVLNLPIPKPGDQDRFSNWVRECLKAGGGRDVALDLWETAYRFDWASGVKVMRSVGPDKQPGPCATNQEQQGVDDLCEIVGERK